jgi:hypothetical protein
MSTLLEIISYFIVLCDAGGASRILYCLIRAQAEPDEFPSYLKKIIHVLIFLVIANVCLSLNLLVQSYFKL